MNSRRLLLCRGLAATGGLLALQGCTDWFRSDYDEGGHPKGAVRTWTLSTTADTDTIVNAVRAAISRAPDHWMSPDASPPLSARLRWWTPSDDASGRIEESMQLSVFISPGGPSDRTVVVQGEYVRRWRLEPFDAEALRRFTAITHDIEEALKPSSPDPAR